MFNHRHVHVHHHLDDESKQFLVTLLTSFTQPAREHTYLEAAFMREMRQHMVDQTQSALDAKAAVERLVTGVAAVRAGNASIIALVAAFVANQKSAVAAHLADDEATLESLANVVNTNADALAAGVNDIVTAVNTAGTEAPPPPTNGGAQTSGGDGSGGPAPIDPTAGQADPGSGSTATGDQNSSSSTSGDQSGGTTSSSTDTGAVAVVSSDPDHGAADGGSVIITKDPTDDTVLTTPVPPGQTVPPASVVVDDNGVPTINAGSLPPNTPIPTLGDTDNAPAGTPAPGDPAHTDNDLVTDVSAPGQ